MKKSIRIIVFVIILILIAGIIIFLVKKPQISTSYNQKGINSFYEGNYKNAISNFQSAAKWNKNWVAPYVNLMAAYYMIEDYEQAKLTISNIALFTDTISMVDVLNGQIALKENNFDQAISIFSIAIEKDNLNFRAYYYRGIGFANINDYEAAISDYKKSRELQELVTDTITNSNLVVLALEDFGSNVSGYDSDVAGEKDFADAFYERGYFKLNVDDLEGAIMDFDRVLEINTKYARAYYYKGLALARSGEFDRAIEHFNTSIDLDYKPNSSLYNIGFAHLNKKDYAKASDNLNKLIRQNPEGDKTAEAYQLLGVIKLSQSNYPAALKDFNKALEINNELTEAYFNRAVVLGYLKRHEESITDLNKCIDKEYRLADVYYVRGLHLINLFRYDDGCKDLSKALDLGYSQAREMMNTYCTN